MSTDTLSVSGPTALRTIHFSPAGRHTRYMLAGYLRHVFMVTSVLLAVALTIDLWPQFHIIADGRGHGALIAIWNVMCFSALRTPDLVAPFLPFATFLGVVWTEMVHTQSGERMLVWNSGRSPIQCLTPVILRQWPCRCTSDWGSTANGWIGPAGEITNGSLYRADWSGQESNTGRPQYYIT
jgi:hypothetical protein